MLASELALQMNDSPQAILAKMEAMRPEVHRAERKRELLHCVGTVLQFGGLVVFLGILVMVLISGGHVEKVGCLLGAVAMSIILGIVAGNFIKDAYEPWSLLGRFETAYRVLDSLQDDAERVLHVDLVQTRGKKRIIGQYGVHADADRVRHVT